MATSNMKKSSKAVSPAKSNDETPNKKVNTGPLVTGCAHYKRKSKFVTPCCNKVYTCRFCHDENEDHTVNRKEVTELVCTNCDIRQPVQADCQYCGIRFGKYTCLECNLFDDEDKMQYHCMGCGICRIGGVDKFFHCPKCNMCLPIQLKNGHRCVENVSRANCPVCLEDIHTSRIPCHIPECGHLLHKTCFDQLLKSGHYACPICQTSLLDMTQLWKYLDQEVEMTPMPSEYRSYKVEILCKDCHKETQVQFHVVGLKCLECGSYNTCRIKGSGSTDDDPTEGGDLASGGPLRLGPPAQGETSHRTNGTNMEHSPTSRQLSTAEFALAILARTPHVPRIFGQGEPIPPPAVVLDNEYYDSDNSSNHEREQNGRTNDNSNPNYNGA